MTKKRTVNHFISILKALIVALAAYLAPSHAEERKYQLEKEHQAQQARLPAPVVKSGQ